MIVGEVQLRNPRLTDYAEIGRRLFGKPGYVIVAAMFLMLLILSTGRQIFHLCTGNGLENALPWLMPQNFTIQPCIDRGDCIQVACRQKFLQGNIWSYRFRNPIRPRSANDFSRYGCSCFHRLRKYHNRRPSHNCPKRSGECGQAWRHSGNLVVRCQSAGSSTKFRRFYACVCCRR